MQALIEAGSGPIFAPWDFTQHDYLTYVDGKPRYDGVQSFLESRGIDIPFGAREDGDDEEVFLGRSVVR